MATVLGDREAAVTRELTKKFEEVVTGRLGELAIRYAESQPKGEIVLVVGPPAEAPPPSADDLDALLLDRLATIGRAPVRTPVTNANVVCRLLPDKNYGETPSHLAINLQAIGQLNVGSSQPDRPRNAH